MPHSVTGFILNTDFVNQICSKQPFLKAISLEQGFSLFPLTHTILKNLDITKPVDLIDSEIPNQLTDLLAALSIECQLLCFATEYFGGVGSQFAIVFENGKAVFGPAKSTIGSINEGLRLLGVKRKSDADEFDTIGLGQYRFTNDWLKQNK
ncbi:MAG: hypothetical protein JNK81_14430 [Anaerolineales bacterium]|nr:hypothetical protein [Anaerolineales bacterium]